mmetsp:Transcript_3544/g.6074  ORF Transcript_3544/g.6074 Transcript_3544/m.6074 type:complete len:661 (-) Transcript_3544:373-2355(-)|eukprot:CAMPEP_0175050250 /NCGR_PEP_ID=MMETSP0052_2-20121109/7161_1 /TAXON_ID=51329 ORGANISM="Polytomella parva, Strain SAG 63-3" /NCGR_SAMPLE_ID=MMETSP0052_2 /ASSEMBLY_ACC=CAM_ASM_000194 /LENGTH=660 /DNA_ID=CAMNT_0016314445 /DNA_START=107 /DNA_END=2089 /DNA_ORIENTATION=-
MTKSKKKDTKKPAFEDNRKPKNSNDANRPNKAKTGMRDAATVRRLNMYKSRAVRDKNGRLLYQEFQSKDLPTTRIQPDRRWFGNTRVIGQKQLENFRQEMSSKVNDGYTVLLREKKLPLQLLEDPEKKRNGKQARFNLLSTQSFGDTFGKNKKRKRPALAVENLEELVQHVDNKVDGFERRITTPAGLVLPGPSSSSSDKAGNATGSDSSAADASAPTLDEMADAFRDGARDSVFEKGQSKRIWGELYKVLDSSDVVVQVLDARDPNGTRCQFLEQHVRKNQRHKHLILLLNKCDLVPSWVTKRWLHYLSREFPVLAFHASINNPFGKGALLSLLRQLARLKSDRQAISIGFVGYPNVGKSSVINTLRTKKVCKAAPIPGETKVWQYVNLMERILCIDCPGVVYNKTQDSESDLVLKGVVRVENLEDATHHVASVLQRVKPEYLKRAYKVKEWTDTEDFLTQVARLTGKLLRGGDADLNTAARMVLYDFQRGKIPFFSLPPGHTEDAPPPADESDDEKEESNPAKKARMEAKKQSGKEEEENEDENEDGAEEQEEDDEEDKEGRKNEEDVAAEMERKLIRKKLSEVEAGEIRGWKDPIEEERKKAARDEDAITSSDDDDDNNSEDSSDDGDDDGKVDEESSEVDDDEQENGDSDEEEEDA